MKCSVLFIYKGVSFKCEGLYQYLVPWLSIYLTSNWARGYPAYMGASMVFSFYRDGY